ncbi:hypothetical protein [uncultured Kriegella sp.]|uniref:hypothetical protein n=1 Tax=uncultured Kriegella sp. TaxID=1798910 RepID=UPI0030D7EFF1|tara:strand:- start:24973 stop:25266 length:294 start_codon:yes stop_codon:yes gene_type:complete
MIQKTNSAWKASYLIVLITAIGSLVFISNEAQESKLHTKAIEAMALDEVVVVSYVDVKAPAEVVPLNEVVIVGYLKNPIIDVKERENESSIIKPNLE